MTFWILIILGIIQGLTEFLPISSSGHLVLLYKIFGIENDTVLLSIILHIATLLAVIVYYRKDIWTLIRHPLCSTNRKIIVTTLFTCIVALILKPIIDLAFDGSSLAIFFVITGILLWISDWYAYKPSKKTLNLSNNLSAFDIENLPLTYIYLERHCLIMKMAKEKKSTVNILTARGCMGNCLFCSVNSFNKLKNLGS